MAQTIASTGDLDDFSLLQKPIQDGSGGGDITQELPPLFNGAVGGHKSGAILMTANNNFQENFRALGWEMFHTKIVNGQKIGFEKTLESALGLSGRLVSLEITHQVKN